MNKIIFKAKKYLFAREKRALIDFLPNNSICAEIGVWKGSFSKTILKHIKPKELHLIDPWQFQPKFTHRWYGGKKASTQEDMDEILAGVKSRFRNCENVFYHRDFSENVAHKFQDGFFDWIYIDGNHYYDYVKKDLEMYFGKVRVGGYITGDDYYWTSPELKNNLDVKEAVDEFVKNYPVEVVKMIGEQFILKKLNS